MKKNVGYIDRIVRVLFGVIVAVLYFLHQITGTAAIVLLILGAVLVLTSLIGFCPIYYSLGLSSKKKEVQGS